LIGKGKKHQLANDAFGGQGPEASPHVFFLERRLWLAVLHRAKRKKVEEGKLCRPLFYLKGKGRMHLVPPTEREKKNNRRKGIIISLLSSVEKGKKNTGGRGNLWEEGRCGEKRAGQRLLLSWEEEEEVWGGNCHVPRAGKAGWPGGKGGIIGKKDAALLDNASGGEGTWYSCPLP